MPIDPLTGIRTVQGILGVIGGLRGLFHRGRRTTGLPPYLQELLRRHALFARGFDAESFARGIMPEVSKFLQPELLRAISGVTAGYGGGIPGIGTALPDTAFGSALRGAMGDVARRGAELTFQLLSQAPLLQTEVMMAPFRTYAPPSFQYVPPDTQQAFRQLRESIALLPPGWFRIR
jgi:hypothetical protein